MMSEELSGSNWSRQEALSHCIVLLEASLEDRLPQAACSQAISKLKEELHLGWNRSEFLLREVNRLRGERKSWQDIVDILNGQEDVRLLPKISENWTSASLRMWYSRQRCR